eukprot:CAMPEP_0114165932 /NCGR_PEP_ID=MMETSP0043_2-20121206/31542_1 /TAXON_ID=464988 /ORGANISM="Hemiselmis andersenii, Strain CCMP644" /LENGTH=57 /DNA_ID=CAMNT_0001262847 /DNA_START=25 /DNA_END=195 /DNA_ORIENTATION=+
MPISPLNCGVTIRLSIATWVPTGSAGALGGAGAGAEGASSRWRFGPGEGEEEEEEEC